MGEVVRSLTLKEERAMKRQVAFANYALKLTASVAATAESHDDDLSSDTESDTPTQFHQSLK